MARLDALPPAPTVHEEIAALKGALISKGVISSTDIDAGMAQGVAELAPWSHA